MDDVIKNEAILDSIISSSKDKLEKIKGEEERELNRQLGKISCSSFFEYKETEDKLNKRIEACQNEKDNLINFEERKPSSR